MQRLYTASVAIREEIGISSVTVVFERYSGGRIVCAIPRTPQIVDKMNKMQMLQKKLAYALER